MKKKFIKYTLLTIFTIFTNNLFSSENKLNSSFFRKFSVEFQKNTTINPIFYIFSIGNEEDQNEEYQNGVKVEINLNNIDKKDQEKSIQCVNDQKNILNKLYEPVYTKGKKLKTFNFAGIDSVISEEDMRIFLNYTMWEAYEEENKKNKLWQSIFAIITTISLFYTIFNYKQSYNPTTNNNYILQNIVPMSLLFTLLIIFFQNNKINIITIKYLFNSKQLEDEKELREKLSNLESNLKKAEENNNKEREYRIKLENDFDEVKTQNEKLSIELQDIKKHTVELQYSKARLMENLRKIISRNTELREKLIAEETDKYNKLFNNMKAWLAVNEHNEKLKKELAFVKELNKKLKDKYTELKDKYTELKDKYTELEDKYDDFLNYMLEWNDNKKNS